MDFVQYINDQESKLLQPNLYFDELWKDITHETGAEDIPEEQRAAFEDHLPVDLPGFFESCLKKLTEALNGTVAVDFSNDNLDRSYICVLIYSTINQMSLADKLVPLNAAQLYLKLCCLPGKGRAGFFHRKIYAAVLSLVDYYLSMSEAEVKLHELLVQLRKFLKKNSLSESLINETTTVLYKVISLDSNMRFEEYPMDSPAYNAQYTSFLCIKNILNRLDQRKDNEKKIILHILFTITSNLSSSQVKTKSRATLEVLHGNTRNFLRDAKERYTKDGISLLSSVIKTLATQPQFDFYEQMTVLMCDETYPIYCDYCWWVIDGLVCNQDRFRRTLPNLAVAIVKHPRSEQDSQKRSAMLDVLLVNMMKVCGDQHIEIKENAFRCLETVLYVDDPAVKAVVKKVVNENYLIMVNVFRRQLDLSWRKKVINRCFVNIICRLAKQTPEILNTQTCDIFNVLFAEASPMDVKPVMAKLSQLTKSNSGNTRLVVTVLKLLVRIVLCPEAISNYFAKTLNDMLFDQVEERLDSSACFNIADVLITKSFEHKDVIKKLFVMNLLTVYKLKVLVNYKVKESPKSLKLLCSMLNFMNYKEFGSLVELADGIFRNLSFQYANLLFYAINKILNQKNASNCTQAETLFLKRLQYNLEQNLETKMFPVHCSTNAVALLIKLQSFSRGNVSLQHIFLNISESLERKLAKINEGIALEPFEICRDAAYTGDFLLQTDQKLNSEVEASLRCILTSKTPAYHAYLNNNPKVWSYLITLHTKLALKDPELVDESIPILEKALNSEEEDVRYHAVRCLQDICEVRLNNWEPLVPHLFDFLSVRHPSYLTLICIKIIRKLVCEDYVKMNESQYVALSSLLGHPDEWFRGQVEGMLKEQFVSKCQKTIASYFVASILNYNRYSRHDVYSLKIDGNERKLMRHQRCLIYKYFFGNFSKNVQFNIVNDMIAQILEKILKGRLQDCVELLEDCLTIVDIFSTQNYETGSTKDLSAIYRNTVKDIRICLVFGDYGEIKTTCNQLQLQILKKLVTVLLRLTFKIKFTNQDLRRKLLHTDLMLTAAFFHNIKHICRDDSEDVRKLYNDLLKYYSKHKDVLDSEEVSEDVVERCVLSDTPTPSTSNRYVTESLLVEDDEFPVV